jgi:hypothetical protein
VGGRSERFVKASYNIAAAATQEGDAEGLEAKKEEQDLVARIPSEPGETRTRAISTQTAVVPVALELMRTDG